MQSIARYIEQCNFKIHGAKLRFWEEKIYKILKSMLLGTELTATFTVNAIELEVNTVGHPMVKPPPLANLPMHETPQATHGSMAQLLVQMVKPENCISDYPTFI